MPAETNAWVLWENWTSTNAFSKPQHWGNTTNAVYQAHHDKGVIAITIGSRIAAWNGTSFWLGFAPQLTNGQPWVQSLDLAKIFTPLLTEPHHGPFGGRVIVIDPGHGGQNSGTRSVLGEHFEKDYTLDWARRLKPLLEKQGWTVYLTRDHDVELSLFDRTALADKYEADLFLSLHFNSSFPKQEAAGLETYCLTPMGMPSNLVREGEDDPAQFFANNHFDEQNFPLALRLHQQLIRTAGCLDRGIRHARFMGVLRGQNRPAVLIEGGYLSNPHEARLIQNPDYRQKLAEGIAKALE